MPRRSSRPPSRQRVWQLTKLAAGLCSKCGAHAVAGNKLCKLHREYHRQKARVQKGVKNPRLPQTKTVPPPNRRSTMSARQEILLPSISVNNLLLTTRKYKKKKETSIRLRESVGTGKTPLKVIRPQESLDDILSKATILNGKTEVVRPDNHAYWNERLGKKARRHPEAALAPE
jgi:hypothetical protein